MAISTSTRSKQEVYLLGSALEDLYGSKLPSIGDVLRLYATKLKVAKTKHEAAVSVIKDVQMFWEKARIPMRRSDHAVAQLEVLVQRWEGLKKNKARRTATQIANEEEFKEAFNDLFDVAHQEALQLIKIEEDKQFLLAQREKGRRGVMAGVDMSLTKKEKVQENKQKSQFHLKTKQQLDIANLDRTVLLESSDSSSSNDDADMEVLQRIGSEATKQPCTPKRKRGRTNILTPALLSSLDRTKTSDRQAVQIIAPIIQAKGHNVPDFSNNRSSIRR